MKKNSLYVNAIFNAFCKLLSVIFPLITISYVSRIFGPSGIGRVSAAQNLISYFVLAASLGIPSYGIKAIAKTHNQPEKMSKTFSELFIINTISTFVCLLLYYLFLLITNSFNNLTMIFSLLLLLNIFNVEWFFQGIENYKYIALRSLAIKVLSLVLLIIFVKKPTDIDKYAFIVCFGTIGNYVLNVLNIKKFTKISFKGLRIKRHFKSIMMFFISVIAIEIYSLLDITILKLMATEESVGYYSNASKIVKTAANTITALGAVLLPRLSFYFATKDQKNIEKTINTFLKVILIISIPMCICLFLMSKETVLLLFGMDFINSANVIKILSPLLILMPFSGGIFGQLLLTSDKEKKYFVCVFAGTIINTILNISLVSFGAEIGVSVASIITELIINIFMLYFCRKIIKFNINRKFVLDLLIASFTLTGMLILEKNILNLFDISVVAKLAIEIITAIVVYITLIVLRKNEIVDLVKKKLKRGKEYA